MFYDIIAFVLLFKFKGTDEFLYYYKMLLTKNYPDDVVMIMEMHWKSTLADHCITTSIFLYHTTKGEAIVVVYWGYCSHELSLFQLLVLECHSPVSLVAVVAQCALDHIQSHPNDVS